MPRHEILRSSLVPLVPFARHNALNVMLKRRNEEVARLVAVTPFPGKSGKESALQNGGAGVLSVLSHSCVL